MAEKPKKPSKLRARLPRGLADRGPAEIAATRAMVEKIREVYERYGFEPVETPAFEYTDALGKFLPDQDRPNEGVFSLQDDDEQWISLRYDLTAPLARYVAENFDALPKPYRSYRFGWVFRNEKPGPGRFRQFMQFDADTVGAPTAAADAEMCMMAADTMEALGIPRGSYVVKVNNRKVLDGVLESIGLGGDENIGRRLTVLRAIDKLDKFPADEIRKLLGPGRWDGGEEGKGDFTKGAELDFAQIESLMQFVNWKALAYVHESRADGSIETKIERDTISPNENVVDALRAVFGAEATTGAGLDELSEIARLVQASGYESRVRIDPSVVRGLEYYTGPVYEVELLLDTKDEKGRPVRFGSVGGGGRYDGLVSRFRGEPVPATGFSIGVSRLQAALTLIGQLDNKPQPGPVVVTVFGGDIAGYQKMVASLRQAGIRAELYLGNPKHSLGQQMKYADKRNSPCAIIQGSDEKQQGIVQIKDLILGAELASLEKDRDEYLKKQAEAQFSCKEEELVAKVQELLQRRGVIWN
ncbi:histidine--tRNA ligase [Rhodopseudomonas sp. BR0M22]|uniref:histidine--tRNA ligase n=1 Tax=Rhodopseudomonas sp. BR0M22 TaxID=2269369 RepID=UPI0013DF8C84|nr:histidine--tRNA ligase [Rhodopseudomonas sp. BR0M22]NEW90923.1 histidine--tRNA ligase [Rhodopseudomonas sp. BR0M22]